MDYTSLVEWDEPNECNVERLSTSREEDQLMEAGFVYLRFDDKLNARAALLQEEMKGRGSVNLLARNMNL